MSLLSFAIEFLNPVATSVPSVIQSGHILHCSTNRILWTDVYQITRSNAPVVLLFHFLAEIDFFCSHPYSQFSDVSFSNSLAGFYPNQFSNVGIAKGLFSSCIYFLPLCYL